MAIQIKPEIVQLIGALLAFAPQALLLKDLLEKLISPIPPEIIPLGYLLLVVGFIWEIGLIIKK